MIYRILFIIGLGSCLASIPIGWFIGYKTTQDLDISQAIVLIFYMFAISSMYTAIIFVLGLVFISASSILFDWRL